MTSALRHQHLEAAGSGDFDVVVIGGGITGSGIVRDLVLRGLRALLVERHDFASGTSSRSSKLIHGGLRYLKYGHLGLVFESCRERRLLARSVAPHIVKPVRMVMPFYRSSMTPRWLAAVGLFLYDCLAMFRNTGRFRMLSPQKLRTIEPLLSRGDSIGGLSFYDCKGLDYRLTIDTLKSAADHGAVLLNYVAITSLNFEEAGVRLRLRDSDSGRQIEIRTKVVINASGVWADEVQRDILTARPIGLRMSKGVHLVLRRSRLGVRHAVVVESSADGRSLFVIPWDDFVLVGTTDNPFPGDPDLPEVTAEEAQYLLDALNRHFPAASLCASDVVSAYAGVRPLLPGKPGQQEKDLPRDYSIAIDTRGVVTVAGGKLTSYRSMAGKVVSRTITTFFKNRKSTRCQSLAPIAGAVDGTLSLPEGVGVASETLAALRKHYGGEVSRIVGCARPENYGLMPLIPGGSMIQAEVDYLVEREFAMTLIDVMVRRTTLYLFSEDHGLPLAAAIASRMAVHLGWDSDRVAKEVADYRAFTEANMAFARQASAHHRQEI